MGPTGKALVIAGVAIAALGLLLPAVAIWLFALGAGVYFPGAFFMAFSARGDQGRKNLLMLRVARIALFVILVTMLLQVQTA